MWKKNLPEKVFATLCEVDTSAEPAVAPYLYVLHAESFKYLEEVKVSTNSTLGNVERWLQGKIDDDLLGRFRNIKSIRNDYSHNLEEIFKVVTKPDLVMAELKELNDAFQEILEELKSREPASIRTSKVFSKG